MKRLIRHEITHEFFRDGQWTKSVRLATKFSSAEAIFKAKNTHHLEKVEMVLLMGERPSPRFDVVLPLQ